MQDQASLHAIRVYLRNSFPDYEIQDRCRSTLHHDFLISRAGGFYKVMVKHTFLESHGPEEISRILGNWQLDLAIRKAETAMVIVGNGGVTTAWPSHQD
jgi:hypothetical protein